MTAWNFESVYTLAVLTPLIIGGLTAIIRNDRQQRARQLDRWLDGTRVKWGRKC